MVYTILREETIRMNKMKQKIESFYQRYCGASSYGITEKIRKPRESFNRFDSLRDSLYDGIKRRR